jgi:Phage gp6-like head-tail connector protein
MQTIIEVLKPATELSLITLFEAKNALNLTDEKSDDLLEFIIKRASDEVARYCNRVFAQETVTETFHNMDDTTKLFLERYPVKEIISVYCNGVLMPPPPNYPPGYVYPPGITPPTYYYKLDKLMGKMICCSGTFAEPTVVTYTGGYELPFESPPALRQAAVLAAREAYYAALRGDATVRMVGHKESRVIYFDPNAALKAVSGGSGGGGSAATRSMKALLERFTRWEL